MYIKTQHEYRTHYGQYKCLETARESKYNDFSIFDGKAMGISSGNMSHLYNLLLYWI